MVQLQLTCGWVPGPHVLAATGGGDCASLWCSPHLMCRRPLPCVSVPTPVQVEVNVLAKGLAKERVSVTIDPDRLRVATTSADGARAPGLRRLQCLRCAPKPAAGRGPCACGYKCVARSRAGEPMG